MLFDDGLNYRSVFLQVGIYIFYIDFSHGIDRRLGLSMQPLHGRCTDRNAASIDNATVHQVFMMSSHSSLAEHQRSGDESCSARVSAQIKKTQMRGYSP